MGISYGVRPARGSRRRSRASGVPLLALADVDDLGAEQRVEQRVGGRLRLRLAVGDDHRAQSHPGRRRRRRSRVIRLHAAGRDQRVGALARARATT